MRPGISKVVIGRKISLLNGVDKSKNPPLNQVKSNTTWGGSSHVGRSDKQATSSLPDWEDTLSARCENYLSPALIFSNIADPGQSSFSPSVLNAFGKVSRWAWRSSASGAR